MTMTEAVETEQARWSQTLRENTRLDGIKIIQKRFKLPNLMAELLYELLTDELKSGAELAEVGINHPQLSIQRLRKTLHITINARRYTGYWIDPGDRARLVRELDG